MICAWKANSGRPLPQRSRRADAGFTLAEVLAAMLFMAIVVPVAVQGLRIASLAGEVAQRKSQAARIAEMVLNETLISSNALVSSFTGTIIEGIREFRYEVSVEPWMQQMTNQVPLAVPGLGHLSVSQPQPDQLAVSQVTMNLLTVEVFYNARGQEYNVSLSTLLSSAQ
jgi:type II secretory pathway pseudopilin PulG